MISSSFQYCTCAADKLKAVYNKVNMYDACISQYIVIRILLTVKSRETYFPTTSPNKVYFHFSWHEIGMYDLPAMIDYVLEVTGHQNLYFVGHSMGATIAVVMLSERSQYNEKFKITTLLAPVIRLKHNTSIFRHSAPLWKALQVR